MSNSLEMLRTAAADVDRQFKITRVETIPLRIPFKVSFQFSQGTRPEVEVLLVRLHTNHGLVGVGETQAWRRQGSSASLSRLAATIHDHFAPHLIGASPFNIAGIMHALDEALYASLYAKTAVSDALFDLKGKAMDVPVYELLGGKCRDDVPICAPLSIRADLGEALEDAQRFWDRGFRTFLIKIGVDPRADYRTVKAIRERFGDELCIRVDANAGMSFDEALKLLKRLEEFNLDTAEQPIAPWDLHGLAELARRITIPIMADECVASDHDLVNVIRHRAATVLQTKQAKNGGIWKVSRLWGIAEAAGMRIYPGNHPSISFATAAVAHLAAAWPGHLLDGPFAMGVGGELAGDVAVEPLTPVGAKVPVPSGPGLGIEIDEDRLRHLRADI